MSVKRTFNTFGTLFQCFMCGARTKNGNYDKLDHFLCYDCLNAKRRRDFNRQMNAEYNERKAKLNKPA